MCTLTWRTAGGGYEVFFNRDERRTRPPARPPAVHRAAGVSYVSPIDAEAGGTWLAVNELGTTLALENGRLALGTWQGIYLCEHRNNGGRRRIVVTLQGE